MNLSERITLNPNIHKGRPTIRNMRFTVANMLQDYSFVEKEDIQACIWYNNFVLNKSYPKSI